MIKEESLFNLASIEHDGNILGPWFSFSFHAIRDNWSFLLFLPTILHVLRDNIDWLLRDNGEEADETWMLQVLHHVGLCQEGFHRHCAYLQVLNCHPPVIIVDT